MPKLAELIEKLKPTAHVILNEVLAPIHHGSAKMKKTGAGGEFDWRLVSQDIPKLLKNGYKHEQAKKANN
jgi:hypothetical protein